ncbi:dual specificity protein phosphatase 8 [Latimeria chalumnae]|nr:PREDICTED: dual specificity protein phosphatase 8 isoform X2 [Latimeria chalumnae]|eukprot:XP_005995342.1 PREDICTED: dual specificity protein phosphatase 8 isoform X2 [Latimeria chalumnae]
MPLDILIAPAEDTFWTEMHETEMKLKIRVRRIREGREIRGGFAAFSSCFPGLCEGKPASILPMSISQPCLPVANVGPTRILPHLYLGSQKDVLNKDLMAQNGITYVLNASNNCPKPDFIGESHFMRIPVNDNYCEKLLPWLDNSSDFIDKAKVSNCRVIVHCLAGISRSATIAIAYIMKTMGLSSDDAYRFVKDRRPSISPNFNFLGQLLEYEKSLKLLKAWSSGSLRSPLEKADGESEQKPDTHNSKEEGTCLAAVSTLEAMELTTILPEKSTSSLHSCPSSQSPSSESKPVTPTTLQQGLNGLHLSAERIQDTNRLKRSFSLDIKSAYSPMLNLAVTPMNTEDTPKQCKLDSPSKVNGTSQFSPVLDSPDRPNGSDYFLETKVRQRRKQKHNGGLISSASSSSHTLSLNFSRTACTYTVHKSASVEDNLKKTLLLNLPNGHQQHSLGSNGLSMWGKHLEPVQPQTPTTPPVDTPWYFTDSQPGHGASSVFGSSAAYSSYSCSTIQSSCEVRLRDKQPEQRDSRRSWHEEGATEKQFKRRSCQMEFEEGISESRSQEDLGKIGKQSSFSGSMEIIEVS